MSARRKSTLCSFDAFRSCHIEQPFRQVDSNDASVWLNLYGGWYSGTPLPHPTSSTNDPGDRESLSTVRLPYRSQNASGPSSK